MSFGSKEVEKCLPDFVSCHMYAFLRTGASFGTILAIFCLPVQGIFVYLYMERKCTLKGREREKNDGGRNGFAVKKKNTLNRKGAKDARERNGSTNPIPHTTQHATSP